MGGRIDMKQRDTKRQDNVYPLCDLTHDIDLGFSTLNFENNYIWGITPGITSVHGIFYNLFVVLGGGMHSRWGQITFRCG